MEVEALDEAHDLASFESDNPGLNLWLKKFALVNQRNNAAHTYVVVNGGRVVAFYSLAAGSIAHEDATARAGKGLAKHPIPVIVITRLAVDKSCQGMGLGKAILKDALRRCRQAADTIGARAVLVHAIDAHARGFYEKYDFVRCPAEEYTLMLLMKDIPAE